MSDVYLLCYVISWNLWAIRPDAFAAVPYKITRRIADFRISVKL